MTGRLLILAFALPLFVACGGDSESSGTSGTDASVGGSSGSGGASSGGSSGNGGAGGSTTDSGTGGSAGSAGCPPTPIACPGCDPGSSVTPECVGGNWICPDIACGDASVVCPSGLVPTSTGCLACAEITDHIDTVIDDALSKSKACNTVDDCTFGATSTTCAGACPVAVAKSEQADFEATVNQLSVDYCQDFVATCGYSTPKCAVTSLGCVNGECALVPN